MIVARNVAIIALLALLITVLPQGGNLTEAILLTLSLTFVVAIGLLVARFWGDQEFNRDTMSDADQTILYASLAGLMLIVAGIDELFASGIGTLILLVVVGLSIYGLVTVYRNATTY